jgi:hypothetical protein
MPLSRKSLMWRELIPLIWLKSDIVYLTSSNIILVGEGLINI